MSNIRLPLNATHIITVNNGTIRAFTFNADGTFAVPNNISLGNTANAFRAIFNAGNITGADKTLTLNNRSGTIALEDNASLIAMLPSTTGNAGKVLSSSDGGSTLAWISAGTSSLTSLNGISTSTYSTQTFNATVVSGTNTGPTWASINNNVNTHTLNIPLASNATTTVGGLLTNTEYVNLVKKDANNVFANGQTFNGTASTFAIPPQITTPGTGTNDVATYGQVMAARNGVGIRPPVSAIDSVTATAGLPTANPVIDGYTIQLNDRVLGTALTGGNAGKIYKATVSLNPVTWVLETDGQLGTGLPSDGDIVFVKSGTTYADQQWAYNGSAWVLYNAAAAYTFSTGLNLSGTTVTVVYGSTGTTACVGNDSRLSDARTPTAHVLDSASHTISGKTAGQVLIATAATTFGFVTFSQDITVSGTGVVAIAKIANVTINDLALQQNSATLNDNTAAATLVTGCSWAIATYRTVKIEYSISRGAGNYTTGYLKLIHDGTTPRLTWVEDDVIGTHGITFSVDINGGNMRLLYQTTSTGTAATMKFYNKVFPV